MYFSSNKIILLLCPILAQITAKFFKNSKLICRRLHLRFKNETLFIKIDKELRLFLLMAYTIKKPGDNEQPQCDKEKKKLKTRNNKKNGTTNWDYVTNNKSKRKRENVKDFLLSSFIEHSL